MFQDDNSVKMPLESSDNSNEHEFKSKFNNPQFEPEELSLEKHSDEIQTDGKKTEENPAQEWAEREEKRAKIIDYLRIATLLIFILFIVSLFLETWLIKRYISTYASKGGSVETGTSQKPKIKAPSRLFTYFPPTIIGYHTKGRRDLTGQDYPKAEAIYEPEDMNLQLRSPIVLYGQAVFTGDVAASEELIQEKLKEFPKERENITVAGKLATSGLREDDSAYFIGTVFKGMAVWFKCEYVELVPEEADRTEVLKTHLKKVSEEILKYMERVETGGAEEEPTD